jgi:hypothetical protein
MKAFSKSMIVLFSVLLFICSCEMPDEEESDWVEVTINAQVIVHEYGAHAKSHTVLWDVWFDPSGDEMGSYFTQMTDGYGETSMTLTRELVTGQTLNVKVSSLAYPEVYSERQLPFVAIKEYAKRPSKTYKWFVYFELYVDK